MRESNHSSGVAAAGIQAPLLPVVARHLHEFRAERESLVMGHDARIPDLPDRHNLRLALDGAFNVKCGSYRTVIDARSFLPLSDEQSVHCTAVPGSSLSWLYVGFSDERFKRAAGQLGIDDTRLMGFRFKQTLPILDVVRQLVQTSGRLGSMPAEVSHLRGRLLELVLKLQHQHNEMIDRIPTGNPRRRRDLYVRLHRTREFLESRYMDDPSVEELASVALLSRAHFLRLYKTTFLSTPHQDLMSVKLMAACALLRSSDQSVISIAEACGFGNRCAFSRLFSQRMGTSPNGYRRKYARTDVAFPGE